MERNPITKLSKDYQNTLISKIEKNFTETQQQLFLASFFCYLNHDNKKDFIIDFDNVWKWTGFCRKNDAKKVLEKNFNFDIDYKVQSFATEVAVAKNIKPPENTDIDYKVQSFATEVAVKQNEMRGGHNKEIILLTVNTFKKFCLKASTKKADEIHDYYIKLEELIQETIAEENSIIKQQLTDTSKRLINAKEEYVKLQENHNRILYKRRVHKLRKGKCFYILENVNVRNEKKIGTSINLNSRKSSYNTYFDPQFLYILFTSEYKLIENMVKVKFKNNIKSHGEEWIVDISEQTIINFVEEKCKEFGIEYETFTKLEDIIVDSKKDFSNKDDGDSNNENIYEIENEVNVNEDNDINSVDSVEIIYTEEETKKCNKCLITKTYKEFNKDSSKKDGFHTTCKQCEKEAKLRYKENKMQKIRENELKEKECMKCKTVQPISEFTIHFYMKDGYCNNCKTCSRTQLNSKRKMNKTNDITYSCDICQKSYSRIDTFNRHKKTCF